jgi:hypothetical protein
MAEMVCHQGFSALRLEAALSPAVYIFLDSTQLETSTTPSKSHFDIGQSKTVPSNVVHEFFRQ